MYFVGVIHQKILTR